MRLGLRARVIGVLVCVSVLTLAVAAITLLSPLEARLRKNSVSSFVLSLRNERGALTSLPEDDVRQGQPAAAACRAAARAPQRRRGQRAGP